MADGSDETAPVPEPEAVPAELREREQWLMWDAAADKPRRPHWRGNFGVSWNDPDDWHSFEEAWSAAQERDSWGIGYVFASTNDDYPRGIYGAIDIDGCAEPGKGRPKDWVPSLEPFAEHDAYIEWSPSETGLHIPLAGFEPPEWWRDVHFTDGEHEGVEVYGSKFFTVTGDKLRNTGDDVADTGDYVETWLREVYKSITGDDPLDEDVAESTDDAGRTRTDREDWLTEEHIRDALDHIDPDVDYSLWRDIGFALVDHFGSKTTARSVFKDWSRGGTKWDDKAERQAERIIDDADATGERTIGTVIYYARQGSWSMPTPSGRSEAKVSAPDGGTAAATANANDDIGTGQSDAVSWQTVRDLYQSGERGTTGEANQAAARMLLDEFELLTVEENDTIWRYNPDTGVFTDDGVAQLRKRLADGLGRAYSRSRVADILHRVRSETYVKRDSLGAPEDLVCVENCVLDLTDPENPEPLPHSPEYRFTWAMNAPYDPDAEATHFRKFLGESVRPEDITKLQEYAGDALRHWKQPRNLCVLLGPTDSGKGVFLRVLRSVFGDENVASETLVDLTDTRWGAHSLLNRPINLANELSTGQLERPERAKNFAGGGDTINVEDKGESKFEATPTANHLFATNQVPQVSNADAAFYNRWLFVTFPSTVPPEQQDEELDTKITASEEERAGILNWLLEGYAHRQQRQGTGFDGERAIAEKEDMWAAYGDSIDRFIATCLTTEDADGDDTIAKKDAYAAYKTMCNHVGVSVESQQKLTTELKKEDGVGESKRSSVDAHFDDAKRPHVYTGVRWTDDGETHLDTAIYAYRADDDTDEDQAGLVDPDGWNRRESETAEAGSEIAQQRAVEILLATINDMTDDGRGDPAAIEDVVADVVHADERARHMIRQLIKRGKLIEDPEGHVLSAE